MARPVVFNWPALDEQAICATQNLAAPGNLTINGTLAENIGSTPRVVFDGISRVVRVASLNDLSAVNFTITGTYRSETVSEENLAGPTAGSFVETTQLFDSVTSVSADAAANGIDVGTGRSGMTHWLNADYYQQMPYKTIQVVVTGTIDYSYQATLDDVQTISDPEVFNPIANLTTASTSQFETAILPIAYSNIKINQVGTDETGSLAITILQQGIK
jgi:hypothetical protein